MPKQGKRKYSLCFYSEPESLFPLNFEQHKLTLLGIFSHISLCQYYALIAAIAYIQTKCSYFPHSGFKLHNLKIVWL